MRNPVIVQMKCMQGTVLFERAAIEAEGKIEGDRFAL